MELPRTMPPHRAERCSQGTKMQGALQCCQATFCFECQWVNWMHPLRTSVDHQGIKALSDLRLAMSKVQVGRRGRRNFTEKSYSESYTSARDPREQCFLMASTWKKYIRKIPEFNSSKECRLEHTREGIKWRWRSIWVCACLLRLYRIYLPLVAAEDSIWAWWACSSPTIAKKYSLKPFESAFISLHQFHRGDGGQVSTCLS